MAVRHDAVLIVRSEMLSAQGGYCGVIPGKKPLSGAWGPRLFEMHPAVWCIFMWRNAWRSRYRRVRPGSSRRRIEGLLIALCIFGMGCILGTGCAERRPDDPKYNDSAAQMRAAIEQPLTPEESKQLMGEVGENWLYGQGLGEAALTVGTSVLFPPYALYVAGNAALSLSGYEEIRISDALPDRSRDTWNDIYDGVTSVPGRITAGVSGNEYRSREVANERVAKFLADRKQNSESGKDPYGDSRAGNQAGN